MPLTEKLKHSSSEFYQIMTPNLRTILYRNNNYKSVVSYRKYYFASVMVVIVIFRWKEKQEQIKLTLDCLFSKKYSVLYFY